MSHQKQLKNPKTLEQVVHEKSSKKGKATHQGILVIPHQYKPAPRMLIQDAPLPIIDSSPRIDPAPVIETKNTDNALKNNTSFQEILKRAHQISEREQEDDDDYGTAWVKNNAREEVAKTETADTQEDISPEIEEIAANTVAEIKAEEEIPKLAEEIEMAKSLEKAEKKSEKTKKVKSALTKKKTPRHRFSLFNRPKRHYSNKLSYDDLVNLEATVGRTIFGPIPEGHRREFFEHRKNVWFWHESYIDQAGMPQDTTVFYEVRPTGVFKKLLGKGGYKKIEGEELTNFRTATKTYLNLIKTKVYS